MSASALIEPVETEGSGGGGVVAAAFGDVQVAGDFEGCGDGGADGGQAGRPAAGPAGGGVLAEGHVADVVAGLDGPLPADQAGQVAGVGLSADLGVQCASSFCHAPAARTCPPPGPDSTTRAPTRDNDTAGMPHLVHADFRDLHDRAACPRPSTVRFRPVSHMPRKTG